MLDLLIEETLAGELGFQPAVEICHHGLDDGRGAAALGGQAQGEPDDAGQSSSSPGTHRLRHLRLLAVLWGGGLLVSAAAHVLIVYSVPASAYLLAAKVARWAILLILIAASRMLRRRWAAPATAEPALVGH